MTDDVHVKPPEGSVPRWIADYLTNVALSELGAEVRALQAQAALRSAILQEVVDLFDKALDERTGQIGDDDD